MRIAVVGASRGLGFVLVAELLRAGHQAVAISRCDTGHLPQPGLRRYFFDVRDAGRLAASLDGVDAVVWTVGIARTRHPVTLFTDGTAALIAAMATARVRRLIAVTGWSAGGAAPVPGPLATRLARAWFRREELADKLRQEALIAAAPLDWTIVRVTRLGEGRPRGGLRLLAGEGRPAARAVARRDLASLLCALAEEPVHCGATLTVGY